MIITLSIQKEQTLIHFHLINTSCNTGLKIIYKLYNKCFKESNIEDKDIDECIKEIKDKYKERVSDETIKNYVRSELKDTYKFNDNNINRMLTYLNL